MQLVETEYGGVDEVVQLASLYSSIVTTPLEQVYLVEEVPSEIQVVNGLTTICLGLEQAKSL